MTNNHTEQDLRTLAEQLAQLGARLAVLEARLETNENATYDFCVTMKRDLQGTARHVIAVEARVIVLETCVATLETDGPQAVASVLDYAKALSKSIDRVDHMNRETRERLLLLSSDCIET